ncbi:MAG: hypothetical protein GC202_14195 [Alphaproteobacteria bacterium]|nr:hypothetical protein [Alphaproteobacteria bacterium]
MKRVLSVGRIFGKDGLTIADKDLGRDLLKPSRNSKYRPHKGKREIERRQRQAARKAEKLNA